MNQTMNPNLDPLTREVMSAVCSHPQCPERVRERLSSILMTGEDPGITNDEMTRITMSETWYMVYYWALRTFRAVRPVDKSQFSEYTLQTLARA